VNNTPLETSKNTSTAISWKYRSGKKSSDLNTPSQFLSISKTLKNKENVSE
jgi:hypothetical protein